MIPELAYRTSSEPAILWWLAVETILLEESEERVLFSMAISARFPSPSGLPRKLVTQTRHDGSTVVVGVTAEPDEPLWDELRHSADRRILVPDNSDLATEFHDLAGVPWRATMQASIGAPAEVITGSHTLGTTLYRPGLTYQQESGFLYQTWGSKEVQWEVEEALRGISPHVEWEETAPEEVLSHLATLAL